MTATPTRRPISSDWEDPASGPGVAPVDDPAGSPNHFREWDTPVDHAAVAGLAVCTFLDVHEVAHPGRLEYLAFDTDDREILLPGLGLEREE